jgi:NAD(P)H-dependent FMN reductase
MITIAIVLGSTRPGRKADAIARWVRDIAAKRTEASFELVDLRDFDLPFLDEPLSAFASALMKREYTHAHTKAWAAKIASFDGYVFLTPEYNHSIPGVLKNALDYLYSEWNNKAAGFIAYGGMGGSRAVEQLRLVLAELQVATVRNEVNLSVHTDFVNYTTFKPAEVQEQRINTMLDQLIAWSGALKTLRTGIV